MAKHTECSRCEHELRRIVDYPRIYVAEFKRISIPRTQSFPNLVYFYRTRKPKAPVEVQRRLEKETPRQVHLRGHIWGQVNEEAYYCAEEKARGKVLSYLNPFFKALEKAVGKEVRTEEVLPLFGDRDHHYIPGTCYEVFFGSTNSPAKEWFKLPELEDKTHPQVSMGIKINDVTNELMPFEHKSHIHLAVLAYEGRLNP